MIKIYIRVPHLIVPRPYQHEALVALKDGKNCFIIIHRRAGKDIICMQMLLLRALQRIGTHLYLAPMQTQIRQIIWKGMDFDGRPFLSAIPECLIARKNDARMEIELINGSRIVFGGSNNISGLIGTNPITIIYSEFALHHPMARPYLNPILIQNRGVEVINTTPRGMNHCWELLETIRDNPKYFIQHLSVEETFLTNGRRVITDEQIEEAKKMGMSEEMVRQEFFVSFDVGNIGSYFTREYADIEKEGRILLFPIIKGFPLHTCWDLGGTDATAGILFQLDGRYINIVHCIHESGKGLQWFLEQADLIRQSFGCKWGHHWVPHDIYQKHQGWEHTESRMTQARKHGWLLQTTPKVNFEDGIESLRYALPRMRFHKANCHLLLRALREYQREYDEVRACYKPKPLDNWATHIVDALRYLSVNFRRLYDIPTSPIKYKTTL